MSLDNDLDHFAIKDALAFRFVPGSNHQDVLPGPPYVLLPPYLYLCLRILDMQPKCFYLLHSG